MKYEFISKQKDYSVAKWAKFLGASASGYYSHMANRETREKKKSETKALIKEIFDDSGGTYGPGRVCEELRRRGRKASRKRIAGYMSEMGLSSIHNKRRTRSLTDSRKARGGGYPNLVRGQLFDKPYQAVCSDITYLKSGEGWTYLCAIKDIVSGVLLGEASGDRMTKDLVMRAFMNAQARHKFPGGMIFHSDRGSQYTSKAFVDLLKLYGIRQSFSRVGMPGDNAWAESFFAILKKECIHFRHFATREDVEFAVFEWIHGFYNTRRIQRRLGYAPPAEYVTSLLDQEEGRGAKNILKAA